MDILMIKFNLIKKIMLNLNLFMDLFMINMYVQVKIQNIYNKLKKKKLKELWPKQQQENFSIQIAIIQII